MKIGEEVQLPMKIDKSGMKEMIAESPPKHVGGGGVACSSVVSEMQDSTTSWLHQMEDYHSKSKTNHIMNSYKDYMEEMKISISSDHSSNSNSGSGGSGSMSVETPFKPLPFKPVGSKDGTYAKGDLLKWTKAQFLQEIEPTRSSNGKIKVGGSGSAHVNKLNRRSSTGSEWNIRSRSSSMSRGRDIMLEP